MTEPNPVTTMLPTSAKAPEESKEQTSKPAPSALPDFSKLTTDAMEYWRDFAQRSVLFMDILRRSGNQYEDMRAHTINSVLIYDFEYVLRGDALPRPVNYALVRVLPPAGVKLDERKRPVVIIDPRAGQGPGIGGFKPVSEIGDAFKFGHPVYFIGFSAEPLEGQRVEDVARAHTVFIEKVRELHPESTRQALRRRKLSGRLARDDGGLYAPRSRGADPHRRGAALLLGRRARQESDALFGRRARRELAYPPDERSQQRPLRRLLAGRQFRQRPPFQHPMGQAIQRLGEPGTAGEPLPSVREMVVRFRSDARGRDAVHRR